MPRRDPHPFRPRDLDLIALSVFLIAVTCLWAFSTLAFLTYEGGPTAFDEYAATWIRGEASSILSSTTSGKRMGPTWLPGAVRDITALGSHTVLGALILFSLGYLHLNGKKRTAAAVAISCVSGMLLSTIMKNFFNRPRPDESQHLVEVFTSSFPSGHALISTVVYLTLGATLARSTTNLGLRVFVVASALIISIAIGISRVYLGVHYASDVLAGWTLGALWAILCWFSLRRFQHTHFIEKESA